MFFVCISLYKFIKNILKNLMSIATLSILFFVNELIMIKTKKIKSISTKLPKDSNECVYINVLTWHDENHSNGSKYHNFSPYFLKTDGQEIQRNSGNILFENFWQGSKVWPVFYDCQIWAHPSLKGNPKHLWFEYKCLNGLGSEKHLIDNNIQLEYYKWRDAIFSCKNPIRYPNGVAKKSKVAFALMIEKDGKETRLDYIQARKQLYVKEYCRLIRQLPMFQTLVDMLKDNKTLVICEIDVPDNEIITIEKLERLVEDTSIKFEHGLCLAWELLKELNKSNS